MASLLNEDLLMKASGFTEDKQGFNAYKEKEYNLLKDAGVSDEELQGIKFESNALKSTNQSWWKNAIDGVGDWAVGDDADWDTYWERGLGKSNINLATQFHSSGKYGYDWQKAMEAEPEDTGALERAFETVVGLGADLPTFIAGGAAGGLASGGNPFGIGFGAGFVNDSIKSMYVEALNRGEVNKFSEWWDIFLKHGVAEGVKGGLVVGSMSVAPLALGAMKIPTNYVTKNMSRWVALTGVGAILDGELPSKETMVNNALILGAFGIIEPKASKMVNDSSLKNKTDTNTIVDQTIKNIQMKEDAGSKNIKTFRKDKKITELEIVAIKKELAELNKLDTLSKPKVVENKAKEIERLEAEVKMLSDKILKPAKNLTESIKEINRTKLKIAEKELAEAKDGKIIEKGQVEAFTEGQKIKLEKETKQLSDKIQEIQVEFNIIKGKKKNGEMFSEDRYIELKNEIKKNSKKIIENNKLLNKDKRILELEEKLADRGETVIRIVEQDKSINRSTDKDVNAIMDQVSLGKIKVNNNFKSYQTNLVTSMIDRLYPILQAVKEAKDRGVKVSALDVYKQMRISVGNVGKGFHFIKHATFDFKTLKDNGKALTTILKDVIKTPDKYRDFNAYSIAKRALEKFEQGIETGFTASKAERAGLKRVTEKFEKEFGQTHKELQEYQQRVLVYLKDSGLLSSELFQRVLELNKDFVPLHKVMDVNIKAGSLGKIVKNPLKKLKDTFGEKQVIDPIENMMLNTMHFINIAEKNATYKSFITMALEAQKAKNKNPELDLFADIKEIKELKPVRVSKEELKDIIIDNKGTTANLEQGMTIFRQNGSFVGETRIAVYENGKPKIYEIGKDFADALKDVNKFQANTFMQLLSVPTRTLRAGATLDPAFIIKNFGRDTFFASIFSKNSFVPLWSSMKGIFMQFGDKSHKATDIYKQFMKSGGMQSTLLSFDRSYFKDGQMLTELTSRKLHNTINPKNWLETLRIASEVAETGSRLADFKMTIKRLEKENAKLPEGSKMSERELLELAGFEARDLTVDFRKMGSSMQGLNMINAFFNARVQGLVKIKEGLADPKRRNQILLNGARNITAPTLLIWYNNKDSQVYKDLPQWQKDLNWIIITNEGTEDQIVWRIPKPFEIGWVFGTLPERILDAIYNADGGKDLINSSKQFGYDFIKSLGPVPEFMKPFIEDATNESMFFERPIVPYALERLMPEYQYSEYTSETAKLIANVFEKLRPEEATELFGPSLDSPAKVENYIKAWTGGLGKYTLDVLDYALKKTGVTPPVKKPWSDNWIKNLADMPIIASFVVRNPSSSSQHITDFWKLWMPVQQKLTTYNYLMSQNKPEEAIKVFDKIDKNKLALEATAGVIKDIGDAIDMMYKNNEVKPNEKRQLIDGWYLDIIEMAKDTLKTQKELKNK